jgi:nicotinate-nucleotide adenylyltransferase
VTRVGLLGGTFDPIHVGHLDVALAARDALGLERVLLVPSRVPPHRRVPFASAAHRFAMAAMAAATTPGLLVSDVEMNADGPSYTAATLDRLAAAGESLGSLFFIIGADAFRDIATWMQYPSVLDRCHFAVVSRPGSPAPALRVALPSLAARMIETPCGIPPEPSIFLVDAPTAPVSSTEVRRRLADGASISGLVPDAVAAHIGRHGLYQARS